MLSLRRRPQQRDGTDQETHVSRLDVKMAWDAHHHTEKMAAVAHHCQDSRSRSLGHAVVARYDICSKSLSTRSLSGGGGGGVGCLSEPTRFSRAQLAQEGGPADWSRCWAPALSSRHIPAIPSKKNAVRTAGENGGFGPGFERRSPS